MPSSGNASLPPTMPSTPTPLGLRADGISWTGRRPYNEDRFVVNQILSPRFHPQPLTPPPSSTYDSSAAVSSTSAAHLGFPPCSSVLTFPMLLGVFNSVYDGHGGALCCDFLQQHLHVYLEREILGECEREGGYFAEAMTCINNAYLQLDSCEQASTLFKDDLGDGRNGQGVEGRERRVGGPEPDGKKAGLPSEGGSENALGRLVALEDELRVCMARIEELEESHREVVIAREKGLLSEEEGNSREAGVLQEQEVVITAIARIQQQLQSQSSCPEDVKGSDNGSNELRISEGPQLAHPLSATMASCALNISPGPGPTTPTTSTAPKMVSTTPMAMHTLALSAVCMPSLPPPSSDVVFALLRRAIKKTYSIAEARFLALARSTLSHAGSTAVSALIFSLPLASHVPTQKRKELDIEEKCESPPPPLFLLVSHVGDSRALLVRRNSPTLRLTEDHKPTVEEERVGDPQKS